MVLARNFHRNHIILWNVNAGTHMQQAFGYNHNIIIFGNQQNS